MKALIRVTLALAVATLASPVFAAETLAVPTSAGVAAHQAAVIKQQQHIAQMMAARSAATGQTATGNGTNAVQSTVSGPRIANPYRSYPPSCAADPLPDTPTGFTYTTQVSLYTRNANGDPGTPEGATITLWRIACSSSGNLAPYNIDHLQNSMLLMRIDRSSNGQDFLPTFPSITAVQQTANGPATASRAFGAGAEHGNLGSTLRCHDRRPVYGLRARELSVHDFRLHLLQQQFPAVDRSCSRQQLHGLRRHHRARLRARSAALPGCVRGPADRRLHEQRVVRPRARRRRPDGADLRQRRHATRTLFAAWYTYDANGIPFWLSVQGVANYGSNTFSNVPVYYYTGGGFAGNFPSVTQHNWGTMNISFPDCTTMEFDFNGAADAVAGGPAGSGSRTFHRLADINGLNCE